MAFLSVASGWDSVVSMTCRRHEAPPGAGLAGALDRWCFGRRPLSAGAAVVHGSERGCFEERLVSLMVMFNGNPPGEKVTRV